MVGWSLKDHPIHPSAYVKGLSIEVTRILAINGQLLRVPDDAYPLHHLWADLF